MKEIGYSHPCFIVAEAGINHGGEMKWAKELAKVAKDAGADAVKFQTFLEEELRGKYHNISYYETLRLKEYCDEIGILFFSTPHSDTAIDCLSPIVPLFKIASTFFNKLLFIDRILREGKPVIISVNEKVPLKDIGYLEELYLDRDNPPIFPLHTVCQYPAKDPLFEMFQERKDKYFVFDWGYSDHTKGYKNCVKAVKDYGACIIEKHIKISDDCVDASHSILKHEFKEMVDEIRKYEKVETTADGAQQTDKVELDGRVSRKSSVGGRS